MHTFFADLNPEGAFAGAHGISFLDYFIVSHDLVHTVNDLETGHDDPLPGHNPVVLSFQQERVNYKIHKLVEPQYLPPDPVFGPHFPGPSWEPALAAARRANSIISCKSWKQGCGHSIL